MIRKLRASVALAFALFGAACSNDLTAPNAPVAQPESSQLVTVQDVEKALSGLKALLETTILERTKLLDQDIVVSATIGKNGGKISIPQTGFELIVPKGAVTTNVKFTVIAMAGKSIAYDFEPHGMQFKKPLQFRQNALHTLGWWNAGSGGYFKDAGQVDAIKGKAKQIDETLPMRWEKNWMVLDLWHFSGYLVSCA